MRRISVAVVTFGLIGMTSSCLAQSAPSVQEVTKQVIKSVTNYANSISCPDEVKIEPKQIAALFPYKTPEDRMDAKFAVIWVGDIGCVGGSGTAGDQISIVTVSTGDSFVVDPLQSSPSIQFESPIASRIVGNTRDSIVLEGWERGENDSQCCPSIKVRATVKVDEKGNWKEVERKVIQSKK